MWLVAVSQLVHVMVMVVVRADAAVAALNGRYQHAPDISAVAIGGTWPEAIQISRG